MNTQRNLIIRRFSYAVAIGLALVAALTFSPSARAAFNDLIKQIGGITYIQPEETTDAATPPPNQQSRVREETIDVSDLQEKFPFEISLPTWVPNGYQMAESARLRYFDEKPQFVRISWSGPNPINGPLELMVGQRINWAVDLSHVQEVQVNGQPAALVGGSWNADSGQWDQASDLSLTWMKGDVMYRLSSPGIPAEDLIRVAESIP